MLPKINLNMLAALLDPQLDKDDAYAETLVEAAGHFPFKQIERYFKDHPPSPRVIYLLMVKAQEGLQNERATKGGQGKAAKLKGPKEAIRQAWASGKYTHRDICAEQEYSSLGFDSFKTARNTLKGTPDPDPWPTKKVKKEK